VLRSTYAFDGVCEDLAAGLEERGGCGDDLERRDGHRRAEPDGGSGKGLRTRPLTASLHVRFDRRRSVRPRAGRGDLLGGIEPVLRTVADLPIYHHTDCAQPIADAREAIAVLRRYVPHYVKSDPDLALSGSCYEPVASTHPARQGSTGGPAS
jgi:hypothetical protein